MPRWRIDDEGDDHSNEKRADLSQDPSCKVGLMGVQNTAECQRKAARECVTRLLQLTAHQLAVRLNSFHDLILATCFTKAAEPTI